MELKCNREFSMSKTICVENFDRRDDQDIGRIKNGAKYNELELFDLVQEAMDNGFNVMIQQTGTKDNSIILWFSDGTFRRK